MEARAPLTRSISLDALRGLAIIAMMVADNVPWSGLPAWMYHGQEPPPSHEFNPKISGITWVDLVFPFFLFSMGAAIPLAQSGRNSLRPVWQNSILTLYRGALLVAFAIFNQHVRPEVIANDPKTAQWFIGVLGFVSALGMFGRFPAALPKWATMTLKAFGWLGAVLLLANLRYPEPDMPAFSIGRSDVIILVLASASVLGTFLWQLSKASLELRVAFIAAIFAFKISASVPGSWQFVFWNWKPMEWLFSPVFLGYLLVVLPGTLAGDLLLKGDGEKEPDFKLGILLLSAIPLAVVVFFGHINPILLIGYGLAIFGYCRGSLAPPQRAALLWGVLWLTLGCLLEPFEGGIKKDPYTFSYLFTTSGLACFTLTGFMQIPRRAINSFASVGLNPLLAYQAVTVLMPSICGLAISPVTKFLPENSWPGLGATALKTAILMLIVIGFTRTRITMRV